jgi:hypothetical protein
VVPLIFAFVVIPNDRSENERFSIARRTRNESLSSCANQQGPASLQPLRVPDPSVLRVGLHGRFAIRSLPHPCAKRPSLSRLFSVEAFRASVATSVFRQGTDLSVPPMPRNEFGVSR